MTKPTKRLALAAALFVASIAAVREARATPNFPATVTRVLGLPGVTIDAPQGCMLCHPSDAGGSALRPFGALLQQYGARPYDESLLEQALERVQGEQPQLVDDIRAGRDPNDDAAAGATIHAPSYGCATAPATTTSPPKCAALLAVVALAWTARRLRTSIARARRRPRSMESARS